MESVKNDIRKLWARQQIGSTDVDYGLWEQKRATLQQMSAMSHSSIFTVDVYKGIYDYASHGFTELLGISPRLLENVRKEGDFIEYLIHPDDREQLLGLQLMHGQFIYSLPPQQRNDYRTVYQMRMRNARKEYVNVTSRQEVIETDCMGKAWMIMGIMELSADQAPDGIVKCSVFNQRTGCLFNPCAKHEERTLTARETEILSLIRHGYLSKEIAVKLGVSIHTVNNHRKNILTKLGAGNAIEAINRARILRLME